MHARRDFLCRSAGVIVAGVAAPGLLTQSRAGGIPVSGTQAPGFYRHKLGSFELTILSDGTISFPPEALWPEASKEERAAVLTADFQPTDVSVLQVNVMAVNTGDRLVLIDRSRGKMMPSANRLLHNLAAAGLTPEAVDTVLITHEHPDHLWGVTDPGDVNRTFSKAEYVIGEGEWNFWAKPDHPLATHESASYHLPFPGLGHVARDGAAFRWVPAEMRWEM